MREHFHCLGAGPGFGPGDTQPRYLPDTSFDTGHVKLVLAVDLEKKELAGSCSTRMTILRETRTLRFDAVAMKIRGAWENGRQLAIRHDGKVLEVRLPSTAKAGETRTIDIGYATRNPGAGVVFVERTPRLWTQGQTDDSLCLFPCRDVPAEKATTEIVVTVPRGFRAVSNGVLVSREGHTFRWRMDLPHSLYVVTLDPDFRIPAKKVEWVKPAALWDRPLSADPKPIGRIEAAQEIAKRGTAAAVAILERAFRRERFWGVQAEIARAIGRIGNDAALEALGRLSSARHPKAARLLLEPAAEPTEFIRSNALAQLGRLGDSAALPQLRKWAKEHVNARFRSTADTAARRIRMGIGGEPPKATGVTR